MGGWVQGISAAIGLGSGLFGAHHANAVAKEQSVNAASQSTIEQSFQDIMARYSGGALSADDAKARLDAALSQFGADTASVRTGGKEFWPNAAGVGIGARGTSAFSGVAGKCNAACVLWAGYADQVTKLKAQIDAIPPKPQGGVPQGPASFASLPSASGGGARFSEASTAGASLAGQGVPSSFWDRVKEDPVPFIAAAAIGSLVVGVIVSALRRP